jgi:uncharacterized protein
MTKHYFEFSNEFGDLIKCDLRLPDSEKNNPLVIFSHGFKGFRNWSFIPYVCEKFAKAGFATINLDYSLNGILDDVGQIYDDSIFRRNKVSVEVSDLSLLISKIESKSLLLNGLYSNWNGDIYLAGHSLGGAISIFVATKFDSVKKISLWASISKLDRNTPRQKEVWKERGYNDITIAPTGQKLHLDYSYIDDKDVSFAEGAIIYAMNKLHIPIQILQPGTDLSVKMQEALELKSTESNIRKRELIVIEKAGHTFNCRHPLSDEPSEAINKAIGAAISFFESQLG